MKKTVIILSMAIIAIIAIALCVACTDNSNNCTDVEQVTSVTDNTQKYPMPMYDLRGYADKIANGTLDEKDYEVKRYDLDMIKMKEVAVGLPVVYMVTSKEYFDSLPGYDVLDPAFEVMSKRNVRMSKLCEYALSIDDKIIHVNDEISIVSKESMKEDGLLEVYYEENGRHHNCGFIITLTSESYANLFNNKFVRNTKGNGFNVEKINLDFSTKFDDKYPIPMQLLNGYKEEIIEEGLFNEEFFIEKYNLDFVNLEWIKNRETIKFIFGVDGLKPHNSMLDVFQVKWEYGTSINQETVEKYAFSKKRNIFFVKPDFTIVERKEIDKDTLVHIYYMKDGIAYTFGFVMELTPESYMELFENKRPMQ